MRIRTQPACSSSVDRRVDYTHMPLVELARTIGCDGDDEARRELHNRVVYYRPDGESLCLVEYIQMLSQSSLARRWCGYDDVVVAAAYDLTVDKFSRLPGNTNGDPLQQPEGPDCRCYLRAFVEYATAKPKLEPPTSAVGAEMAATEMLRILVKRHFRLSCLECRRRAQKLDRRYIWRINGRALYLWVPLEMPGRRCRQWLEANIPDVDPTRCGEKERVQAMINRLLGHSRIRSIHTVATAANDVAVKMDPVASLIREEISVRGLAQTVADEKAETVEQQRPAIGLLGPERLRQLILEVFDALAQGDYRADRIASHFGVSQATFSRFAGNRWQGDGTEPVRGSVPDLWVNTARTLSHHPDFVAAAQQAGVWKRVEEVLDMPATGRRGEYG